MALKRSSRQTDQSNKAQGSTTDKDTRRRRITNSSQEINRNEEQTSPSGKSRASDQWNQKKQDLDRSSGRSTPLTERPEASQWNQGTMERNQTTGSNIPGSEIKDRNNPNAEQWNQTSRDQYPTSNKSSPTPKHEMPGKESDESMEVNKTGKATYTGNSERAGQQYSITGNSSRVVDKDLKSGHPAHDKQNMHSRDVNKRSAASNKGMKQQQGHLSDRNRTTELKQNAGEDLDEE